MKRTAAVLGVSALCLQLLAPPVHADMTDAEKGAAAIAILGIATLLHNKHHYKEGYAPASGDHAAEFERGYRDAKHGYSYDERNGTKDYAEGYQAGIKERENSMAHRQTSSSEKAPPMALKGCAEIVAQNFAVGTHSVHFIKMRSPAKHEWEIEASVGHSHMVCKMRDSGELLDLRGGKL